jgi:hypothetical protein
MNNQGFRVEGPVGEPAVKTWCTRERAHGLEQDVLLVSRLKKIPFVVMRRVNVISLSVLFSR